MAVQSTELVQVVLRLSRCRATEEIVAELREAARTLTGADGVTVVMRDGDKCHYADENAIAPLWKGKRFPMSACISGWCMIHKQQVVIKDIYADDRIPHEAYRPTFVKSLAMTPIRSADPVGAIGAYWATNHEATSEELATLQALGDSAAMAIENCQLIESLKEASSRKDAFLSMLAHELRTPLSPIRNGVHLLKLQGDGSESVMQAAEMMDRQVVHLSRIVDELLDVARINSGRVKLKRARIDLAGVVRECVMDHRKEIEDAGLTLNVEIPVKPVWIEADGTRLMQVVHNLLDNARKYTPGGGRVSVNMQLDPSAHAATITVEDTGVGIAPKLLPRVFDAFTQADTSLARTGGGLGLGLAVANGLVKLHEGTLTVHSEGVGQGARFTVTLPGIQEGKAVSNDRDKRAASNEKLSVLIIEDNRDTAHSLQRLLTVCGFATTLAYDGAEGVEKARAQHPDVVVCDIGLPKLDGYRVAEALRNSKETAAAKLIAVTGYGSEEDRDRARSAGFDAHLVKPIDLEDLLTQIRASKSNNHRMVIPPGDPTSSAYLA